MMRKEVLVVAIDGKHAMVTAQRQSACSSCGSRTGCDVKSCGLGQQDLLLRANNPAHAQAGEYVVLELSERQFLKSSFLVYAMPIVLFLLVTLLVNSVMLEFGLDDRAEMAGGLAGVAAFIMSFVWLRRYNKRIQSDDRSLPTIVQVK